MEVDYKNYSLLKNKYKILEYKNKGGFSKVYLVEDIDTKKQYAAKLLKKKKLMKLILKRKYKFLKRYPH